uniref:Protein commissureless n=1 Tax=Glossina austeni TaxID=7395 RepID=A0A1A9V4E5_GLOAU
MSPSSTTKDYLELTIPTASNTPPATFLDTVSVLPNKMDIWMNQLQKDHPEISFVIPNHRDNQHIDNMMNFKRLLEQVGNTAYDTIGMKQHTPALVDSYGHTITGEQISKTAVLDMAALKQSAMNGFERFFFGTDMNTLVNYLWIGIVTSLVILSVVFILFSCYFYRKFREWKKCNKDIRSRLNHGVYTTGHLVPCDSATDVEAAFYQMESSRSSLPPPCYTIATGLPTYDEAIHNRNQQPQHKHFTFGMKFVYPALSAVHPSAANSISSWEKHDLKLSENIEKSNYRDKQIVVNEDQQQKCNEMTASPLYDVTTAAVALLTDKRDGMTDSAILNITKNYTDTVGYSNSYEISNLRDLTDIVTV